MKKTSLIILISIIFIITGSTAAAANNTKLNINYGYGGEDYESHSFGIEYLSNYKKRQKIGFGFFAKETESGISYPELDYSVPHNDYYYAGTHVSEELGIYLIYRIIAEKASPMIMGGDESAILIFSQCGN